METGDHLVRFAGELDPLCSKFWLLSQYSVVGAWGDLPCQSLQDTIVRPLDGRVGLSP